MNLFFALVLGSTSPGWFEPLAFQDPPPEQQEAFSSDSPFQIREKEPAGTRIQDFRWRYEYTDYDEWTFEFEDNGTAFGDELEEDVQRHKTGFLWLAGREQGAFVLSLFAEETSWSGPIRDDASLLGVEVGVQGTPRLQPHLPVSPLVDYGILVSPHYGQGDDVIDDLFYFEAIGQFGIGIDVYGFQVAGGIRSSLLLGRFNLESAAQNALNARGETIFGVNNGGYASLMYRGRDFPLVGRVQLVVGNLTAAIFSAGVRF
jgi:hypothetical protein